MTTDLERRVRAGLREYVESVPVKPPPAPIAGSRRPDAAMPGPGAPDRPAAAGGRRRDRRGDARAGRADAARRRAPQPTRATTVRACRTGSRRTPSSPATWTARRSPAPSRCTASATTCSRTGTRTGRSCCSTRTATGTAASRRRRDLRRSGRTSATRLWQLSPDGRRLAFYRVDRRRRPTVDWSVLDLATGSVRPFPTRPRAVADAVLAWSPDARRIAYCAQRTPAEVAVRFVVWDLDSGRLTPWTGSSDPRRRAFSPDGRRIAVRVGSEIRHPGRGADGRSAACRSETGTSSPARPPGRRTGRASRSSAPVQRDQDLARSACGRPGRR